MFSTPPPVHELVEMGKVGIFFPGIWDWFVWVRYTPCPLSMRRSVRRVLYQCQRRLRRFIAVCSVEACLRTVIFALHET